MNYHRYEKLQKYYIGKPVDPAIYKQGSSLGIAEYSSLASCENGGEGTDPEEVYYYRIISDGYVCIDVNKYQQYTKQYSLYPNGPWYNVVPEVHFIGDLIEANSYDCGFIGPDMFRKHNQLTLDTSILTSDLSETLGYNEDTGEIYLYSSNSKGTYTADFNGNIWYNQPASDYVTDNITYIVKDEKVYNSFSNCFSWRNLGENTWHNAYYNRTEINNISYIIIETFSYSFGKSIVVMTTSEDNSPYYISKATITFDETPTVTFSNPIEIVPPNNMRLGLYYNPFNADFTYNLNTKTIVAYPEFMANGQLNSYNFGYLLTINTDNLSYNFIQTNGCPVVYTTSVTCPIIYKSNYNFGYCQNYIYDLYNEMWTSSAHGTSNNISPLIGYYFGNTYLIHKNNNYNEKFNYVEVQRETFNKTIRVVSNIPYCPSGLTADGYNMLFASKGYVKLFNCMTGSYIVDSNIVSDAPNFSINLTNNTRLGVYASKLSKTNTAYSSDNSIANTDYCYILSSTRCFGLYYNSTSSMGFNIKELTSYDDSTKKPSVGSIIYSHSISSLISGTNPSFTYYFPVQNEIYIGVYDSTDTYILKYDVSSDTLALFNTYSNIRLNLSYRGLIYSANTLYPIISNDTLYIHNQNNNTDLEYNKFPYKYYPSDDEPMGYYEIANPFLTS